jgi:DDE family transposase
MMGFVTFNGEGSSNLCAAVLRPGNVTEAAGAAGILRRLMALIRGSFPKARIRVRLDGGFANPPCGRFWMTNSASNMW